MVVEEPWSVRSRGSNRKIWTILPLLGLFILAGILAYNLPFVQDQLGWRVSELRARIKYAFSPPQEAVFTPDPTLSAMVEATLSAVQPTTTPAEPTPTQASEVSSPAATPTATQEPTPLPESALLRGVRHEYQQWNNCGPATLSMGLSFWGWPGNQSPVAAYTKPNPRDKNVMPYEMVDFVESQTEFSALTRMAGDLELLKRFIASGFPVIIEKGYDVPDLGWMGHYQLLVGYDDAVGRFNAFDSYEGDFSNGKTLPVPYAVVEQYWPHFNYTYIVIYPADREEEVMALLGPDQDVTENIRRAAQRASNDIFSTSGRAQFFAWFNRGSALMQLQDYAGGAAAFDEAFKLDAQLALTITDDRPWRVMWYRTGPYWAYFYTGRYWDVFNLATKTLDNMSEPVLEESYYWRALAKEALGDLTGARQDLERSLDLHPGFEPALQQLERMGAAP